MGGKGKGSQTQTQQNQNVQYTPYGIQNLQNIYNTAANAASQPYRPYKGDMVADWNKGQQAALSNFGNLASGQSALSAANVYGTSNRYTRQAIDMIGQAARPISAGQINHYMDPYTDQVVNATMANIRENNQAQQQQLQGNAALRGTLGGDRSAVMAAELGRQQDLATNQTVGNLRSQGYSQALNAAMAQQQAKMAGGYQIGALGQSQAGLGYAGQQNDIAANQAYMGAATQKQQNNQADLNATYSQYQQMMAYPYQQAQFLASIGIPAASAMGGFQTQIGQANQTYTPPFWNLRTGGAVPFRRGGRTESPSDDNPASHYFGVGNPNASLPFHAGNPIYLPGQTIQPRSQLIGPNGVFYAGQNPSTTPNQGRVYNAVPISGASTPNEVRTYINSNPNLISYRPGPIGGRGHGGRGQQKSPGGDDMTWDPKLGRWVPKADDGSSTVYAEGGQVPMPWEMQPFSITGGGSPYPGAPGGGGMAPIQVPDSKPSPMPMPSPSPPPQQGKGPLQQIGDLTKLYNMGKKGFDSLKPAAAAPTDISAPSVGQASGATLSQGTPGGTAGFGGYGELGGSALPSANPATAVGSQFLQGQAASAPGLAAGAADTAAGAIGTAGAEAAGGLAGIGAGEAALAAGAETGLGAAAGAAGLEAIGATAATAGAAEGLTGFAALLALLSTGGRVYADGGGIDESHPPTVPESIETLRAQQNQLIRGVRKAQMFPPGTKELPLPSFSAL